MHPHKTSGFNLIELLIVLLIIGGLAVLTYPAYITFLLKAHRTDALLTLEQERMILEQCYAQNNAYNKPCNSLPNYPHYSTQGHYQINLINRGPKTYVLAATAVGNQNQDSHCIQFTINQVNEKVTMDATGTKQVDC